jgi:5-methylcytosine-specific restriction endonuclease McrA
MTRVRNYRREYDMYHARAEQKKNRAKRNAARRAAARAGKVSKGDGKEVDHKRPLSRGGGNGKGNLRVTSRSANRRKGTRSS